MNLMMLPKACRVSCQGPLIDPSWCGCARHKPSSPMVLTSSCVELCHVRSSITVLFSGALRSRASNAQFVWVVVIVNRAREVANLPGHMCLQSCTSRTIGFLTSSTYRIKEQGTSLETHSTPKCGRSLVRGDWHTDRKRLESREIKGLAHNWSSPR